QYLVHGGAANAREFLKFAAHLTGFEVSWLEPRPILRAGLYWPGLDGDLDLAAVRENWRPGAPVAALVFYRALVQAGNLQAPDELIGGLAGAGLNPLPMFVSSLRDEVAAATLENVLSEQPADVVLNSTGFAVSAPGAAFRGSPFAGSPVIQVVFAGSSRDAWAAGTSGLAARDIAMNVALPEVDGRIISRAVSFKGLKERDDSCETDIVSYDPDPGRVRFVSELAANWARLAGTPAAERRVALVLANYPNRDGRIGNGVGLDTPAATVHVLKAMAGAGYRVGSIPDSGDELVRRLQQGPTNDIKALAGREVAERLPLDEYDEYFAALAQVVRDKVIDRWGKPEDDPFFNGGAFAVPAFVCSNIAVGLQPARGYNIDPASSYHDPDLPPPHGYLAFYAWLRGRFKAHAVVHMGKHGNLEWLPGKALALSEECFPEAAFGPMVNLYPFIVNDPGEGAQAKRRAQAVIIDHLTPPLTRAESYGPLRDLEQLVDEYYEAAGVDPRRLKVLRRDILELCQSSGLAADLGMVPGDDNGESLKKLDNHLCELKEMQIRDGLHIFGQSPVGGQLDDLLAALVRAPRGNAGFEASLHRSLALDLGLGFDPLDCEMAEPWRGPRPEALALDGPWRTMGDTVERLEGLALQLISGQRACEPQWKAAGAVLEHLESDIRPAVESCGELEIRGLLGGLDGRFVEPGPSGAPSRGRIDVLPTGRNFYSVDTRTVPTPAAWTLGWKSASLLVERHMQDHGAWPRSMAITAWGTSNMRTGGDDIAQALALMGVRPAWDPANRRVTGFEIMPHSVLGRPRVDVTLRVSGFFRDAFPAIIDLFDSAVRAVAALDEPNDINPLRESVESKTEELKDQGMSEREALRQAGYRVFGSKPGSYGAGLQALIDEKGWRTEADLARAYIAWGGYAYGAGSGGEAAHGLFEGLLETVEAVVQNQDNREHDLLDSDDYYQFEGGIAAAVGHLSGAMPAVYHPDHSRPETPKVRTLDEEIARVVRARVVNPKWIQGVMRHGYKGAFEMAATVDYMFAFAATAKCVKDHHFDAVFDAYLADQEVRDFLQESNPAALKEMSEKLLEAQERGLWRPRLNSAHDSLVEYAGQA
ncbi:MAG: cobaltochelatase subunit CobN, partial [Rhodospirillales bacterium]